MCDEFNEQRHYCNSRRRFIVSGTCQFAAPVNFPAMEGCRAKVIQDCHSLYLWFVAGTPEFDAVLNVDGHIGDLLRWSTTAVLSVVG